MKTAERYVKAVFAGLCAYECVSVLTGRAPTISALCRRRRWVEAGLLAFLLLHLHHAIAVSAVPDAEEATA